jgi:DNA segregation ATPase FtsK/SpoIIIE, S-DNA-T family
VALASPGSKGYYMGVMAKSKSNKSSGFRHFLLFAGICCFVILVIALLVFWQWPNISNWFSNVTKGTTQIFGWGILLVVLAVLTLAVVILSKASLLWRHWNKWIGGLFLLAAVWGLFGLLPGYGVLDGYSLGGKIGQSIVSSSLAVGIVIVFFICVFGILIMFPRGFSGLVSGLFAKLLARRPRESKMASEMPVPQTQSVTQQMPKAPSHEPQFKNTVFPRYKADPARTVYPVYGSKNWLWQKLHPQKEPETSLPTVDVTYPPVARPVPEDSLNAASLTSPEPIKEAHTGSPEALASTPAVDKNDEQAKPAAVKDIKQAAEQVWKKYGEAGTLPTSDGWKLPSIEILDNVPEMEFNIADNTQKAKLIEDALSSYGVDGKVVQINVGPTVTQFGVEPGWDVRTKEIKEKDKNGDVQVKTEEVARTRVKVDRITSLANDLSLALAAPSIRIEAPVPGKSVVGIEVPNSNIGVVSLRSVVESNVFQKMQAKARLSIALGKGSGGESVVGDLTKMPHLLIAGATGSGKTVCIHSIICCLLLHNTPNDVRFIMIDPKRVELTSYNSLPHLATPVIVETNRALLSLRWMTQEMDKRYQIMAAARARNIEAYNKIRPNEKFPYLVLVIDELADLMMTAGNEVETTLCRLAQLARAVGIHLIVATQRPSVDVVTGLIKANFPSRISFAVTSQVDSRTILDSGGAEKLLGRGDMLYMPTEASKAKRLQGCFLSDPEIERIVYFWNNQRKETASQLKMEDLVAEEEKNLEKAPEDPMLIEARKLMEEHEHVSASFLQRHLRIGYPRAARLMEQLEEELRDQSVNSESDVPPDDDIEETEREEEDREKEE